MRNVILGGAMAFLAFGCSGRKVDMESASPTAPDAINQEKDARIESLTSSLSRAQSRIEELDAKVAALTDKLDATRIAVDNVTGNKPLSTEPVGSARESEPESSHPSPAKAEDSSKIIGKSDGATGAFNKAMTLFRNGKFADSELAFSHFTETFPEHVLAGSAQFYAGESYFMMNEYKLALNEYGKVAQSFGSSPRVASALVRMAHCHEATGNAAEAARIMATAKDLFDGNPSLEWPGASKQGKPHAATEKPTEHHQSHELTAAPIEPAPHEHEEEHGH